MARVHFAWRVTRSELWHNALWLVHCLPNNPLIGCKNWTFKSSLTIKRFLDRAEYYDKHGTLHCKDQLSICCCIDARETGDIVWWHWLWRIPRSQSPVMNVLVLDNGSCDIQHSGWVIRHLQRVYHVNGWTAYKQMWGAWDVCQSLSVTSTSVQNGKKDYISLSLNTQVHIPCLILNQWASNFKQKTCVWRKESTWILFYWSRLGPKALKNESWFCIMWFI